MQLEPVLQPPPRAFSHSLDWRFLLPIADARSIHVLSDDDPDLGMALEQVGIPISNPEPGGEQDVQAFVLPFGLPVRRGEIKKAAQVESYRSIRRSMRSGGYLLVGFNNRWDVRGTPSRCQVSTPRQMRRQLTQAGFNSVTIFGAMPDLSVPEYIFELDARAIRFALLHRFRRKPVLLNIIQALAGTIGVHRLASFLPCYFALATA